MANVIVLVALGALLAGCASPPIPGSRDANVAAIRAAEPAYQGRIKLCMQGNEADKVIECAVAVERANYADIGIQKPAALEAYLVNLRALFADALAKPKGDQTLAPRGAQMRAGYLTNLANPNF